MELRRNIGASAGITLSLQLLIHRNEKFEGKNAGSKISAFCHEAEHSHYRPDCHFLNIPHSFKFFS